jgi:GTP cyclohydrolase IA
MKNPNIEKEVKSILVKIGEDPNRPGLKETPKRVAKAFEFFCKGYQQNPEDVIKTFPAKDIDQMIVVKNIDFYSKCEHHLETFYGQVHIGYLPKNRVMGVSKFARLVEIYSRRLQIQERMTEQIADAIMKYLKPQGVAVVVEGIHLCMRSRGIEKQNTKMITSIVRGKFRNQPQTKEEFLKLI